MITATRQFKFCYGHFLPEYDGKCQRLHGHNATLEVEVKRVSGVPSYPDMVLDFGELKGVVEPVVEQLDHQCLNDLPPWDSNPHEETPPTAESMVEWIRREIVHRLPPGLILERVRVSETDNCWVEWRP